MLEEFHSESPVFRLTFSQIKCEIKLQELSILALAVKIGKNYSKHTTKMQLKNGQVQFPEQISIPIEEDLVFDRNPRKQKCEVMLYRYYPDQKEKAAQEKILKDSNITKKDKQKKNLIGMTTVLISGELFSEKVKTFRITNTFDKNAFISCNIKICHDIFQNNDEKISSIGQRSNTSSTHKDKNLQKQKPLNGVSQIIRVQKQLNSKNKKNKISDLNISRMSEQNKPVSTRQMGSYSQRHMIDNYEESDLTKTQKMYGPKHQTSLGRIKRNDKNVQSYSERYERKDSHQYEDNQQIFQLCNNLQEQNNLLMNKIQNLENHILNKSTSGQTAFEQGKINKSQSLVKALMIKKNNKFTTSVSTSVVTVSNKKSLNSTKEKTENKPNGGQSPKILANESNFSFKPPTKMMSIKEMDFENQSSKIITPRSQLASKISFGFDQNLQVSHFENLQVKDSGVRPLKIDNVITVSYIPPLQPITTEFSSGETSRVQKIERSISQNERSFSRSYSKFNTLKRNHIEAGPNKYYLLNEIKKKDFGLQTEIEEIPKQLTIKKTQIQLQTPILVTVNGFLGLVSNVNNVNPGNFYQAQQKNRQSKHEVFPERSTLQDMSKLIQKRFRKGQNQLKLACEKLMEQNKSIKKEKKELQTQLEKKKHLSAEEIIKLQSNSGNHEMQIKYYIKMVAEKDEEIEKMSKGLRQAQEQTEKLQKNLREQKKTVGYFIKTSQIHDDKQKELEMKLKLIEEQFQIQDSKNLSQSNHSKSRIVMPSPRVIYHSNVKMFENQSQLTVKKEQKGYRTSRHDNVNASVSHYVPQIRFNANKMIDERQNNYSTIIPYSKNQMLNERQKSIESKGLLSLKKHSVLYTKRTHDLSRQPNQVQNSFDHLLKKTNSKSKLNIYPNYTQRNNLSIQTRF